jgi:hypothetical protein
MRALICLLLLAGCASPQPKTVTVTETKTVIVNKYIVIHERPAHSVLIHDYEQTLDSEKPIVLKSRAPTISRLITLDDAARAAFAPISAAHHRATPAEITRAITALGALQTYVGAKK